MAKTRNFIISFYTLRQLVGFLGIILPFVCIIGGVIFSATGVQRSISYYYHSNMRDFFVGLMCCVALFLFSYKGYDFYDDVISNLTGLCGLGLALFPCKDDALTISGIFRVNPLISEKIHLTFAVFFFIFLAINSIFLFTRSDKKKKEQTLQKKIRNIIYISSGVIISICVVILGIVTTFADEQWLNSTIFVLTVESIMLFFFGFSWIVKGNALFKDKNII